MVLLALKNINKPETNMVELEIEVGAEEFESAVQQSYLKNRGNINIPGFRKGMAPRKIIEKMYGAGFFYEDAVNSVYPKAYDDAVKEAAIAPVDSADIDVVNVDENGLLFKAKVTVKPEVEITRYKELAADKIVFSVKDDEIDTEIDRVRQRNARLVTVEDRPAENDDTVVIDFEGFVDDIAFEGGKGENFSLKLGSGQFIPGFEEQLVGIAAGGETDVDVTFPEAYHDSSLSGKKALFKVKVHEIKKTELPVLDDEFAKDVSEFDSFSDYRNSITENLTQEKQRRFDEAFEGQVMDALAENLKAEIPEVMYEKQLDNIVSDYDGRMRSQGFTLDGYLQHSGSDMAGFRDMFRLLAEKQVKTRLALEKVAEIEKIVISDQELEDEYKKIAENYKTDIKQVKSFIPKEDLLKDISVSKALEFVKNYAKITELTEEEAMERAKKNSEKAENKEKPIKKTTAKAKASTAKKAESSKEKKDGVKEADTQIPADDDKETKKD